MARRAAACVADERSGSRSPACSARPRSRPARRSSRPPRRQGCRWTATSRCGSSRTRSKCATRSARRRSPATSSSPRATRSSNAGCWWCFTKTPRRPRRKARRRPRRPAPSRREEQPEDQARRSQGRRLRDSKGSDRERRQCRVRCEIQHRRDDRQRGRHPGADRAEGRPHGVEPDDRGHQRLFGSGCVSSKGGAPSPPVASNG